MFAYCNNNPVNALDSLGTDAIWLQDTNNAVAGPLGHTGLLIQDSDGTWYYLNWTNSYCCCIKVSPIEFDYESLESLMTIDGDRYDAAIYLEGDFSQSVIHASELADNYSPEDYKLMKNNCMQVVTDVLMEGKFEQNDASYKLMLAKSRNSIIPNVAFSRMVNFYAAEQAYNSAPNWAKWLYTSPERAAMTY